MPRFARLLVCKEDVYSLVDVAFLSTRLFVPLCPASLCLCTDILRRALRDESNRLELGNLAVFLTAGPGCGKSRALQDFFKVLLAKTRDFVEKVASDGIPEREELLVMLSPENHVQLGTALYNGRNGGALSSVEGNTPGGHLVAQRALYSALGLGTMGYSYSMFIRLFCQSASFTFGDVLSWIAARRHEGAGRATPMVVTFVIDEVQNILDPW
jgi:hypothetical protein